MRGKITLMVFSMIFMTLSLLPSHFVEAHSGSSGYSEMSIKGNNMKYDLYLLGDLVGGLLTIDKNQDGYMKTDEITASQQDIEAFVKKNLIIKNNGKPGEIHIKNITLADRSNLSMFLIEMEIEFPQPIKAYEIEYSFFYDEIDANHQNYATIHEGSNKIEHIFTNDKQIIKGKLEEIEKHTGNVTLGFGDFVLMGMKHIWSGIDHLLFLFGLLLGNSTFRDYMKTLTAFTVGHCITLGLAATETFMIPSSIIEPLIALSIVYVAVENIWSKTGKRRWLVAGFFGLIHGFGFAELLVGKLGRHFIFPLFSFNLGIEIGQMIVLMILLPFIWYLRKTVWQKRIVYSLSSVISTIGLYWFIERIW